MNAFRVKLAAIVVSGSVMAEIVIDFDELQRLLGTTDLLALGGRYDDSSAG